MTAPPTRRADQGEPTGRVRWVRTRPVGLVLATAALVSSIALAGCASAPAAETARPSPSATSEASPTPSQSPPTVTAPATDASLGSVAPIGQIQPVRLALPELDIDMAVEPEGLDDDGAMALPEDAATAGWYRFGPGLRDAAGATVIAAHIDSFHDGIGPFSRLKDASPGSTITVAGSDGSSVDYTVMEVRSVGKIDAPMAEVFDRAGAPRLTLITCGGEFDSSTGHYVDNVILTATPQGAG